MASATLALDMLTYGSVYHPLSYFYEGLSWGICQTSPVSDCPKTSTAKTSASSQSPGMVVTSHHKATEVGIKILKAGGNAVDAAVAIGYALAVVDPCCGNLGGGGFMLIHFANGKSKFINFREKAPLAATTNMYLDQKGRRIADASTQGYRAIAVPGTVMGLNQALAKYGRLSRQQVMAPAIALAETGFILETPDVRILRQGNRKFLAQPNVSKIFLKHGKPLQTGDQLVQKDLARTLRLLAKKGEQVFYQGEIGQAIVRASQQNGGILATRDFKSYQISEAAPLRCIYRGYKVLTTPLPGGGVTLCQMLNILEGYPLQKWGWETAPTLHVMLSSMLFAYSDRNTYLGDPNFVSNPVQQLISKDYAKQIRSQIPPDQAIPPEQVQQISKSLEGTNTTHYSVKDRAGNAVAVTYTINSFFGAGVIAENTGFFLNNEMDDFAIQPGVANQFKLLQGERNAIAPGKQPLSSMTPTILTQNQQVVLVTGSPGGSTIPTTVLQVILNVVDHEMPIAAAVNATRIHYQGRPNVVLTEPFGLPKPTFLSLWEMGYRVAPFYPWGAAESIWFNPQTGLTEGGRDDRKPAGSAISF
ncbi:MAG: gamma-glutamyltransferase [Aphanocapsa sp. GSE-SYN-MK-11-07L]|nr:gamma-glutamyltransferase [Aphanocapsa sp. GSE-SYN-MK-11-07L]